MSTIWQSRPTFVRLVLDGPVLPHVTNTIRLPEQARVQLLDDCKRLHKPSNPRLAVADLPAIAPAF